jgi:hypothetical protein
MDRIGYSLGRSSAWFRVAAFLALAGMLSACASSTVIRSRPEGAAVFIDNIEVGKTPANYSDTAIAGTVKSVRIKKEGYKPLDTVIRKDTFQVGPCIGGVLILFPFIWILGYQDVYEFELEPEKAQ